MMLLCSLCAYCDMFFIEIKINSAAGTPHITLIFATYDKCHAPFISLNVLLVIFHSLTTTWGTDDWQLQCQKPFRPIGAGRTHFSLALH